MLMNSNLLRQRGEKAAKIIQLVAIGSSRNLVSFKDIFGGGKGKKDAEDKREQEAIESDKHLFKSKDLIKTSTTTSGAADSKANQSMMTRRLVRFNTYDPPSDIENRIKAIWSAEFGGSGKNFDPNSSLSDRLTKFKLLTNCEQAFGHEISNMALNDIQTIRDLIEYYARPVSNLNPLEEMIQNPELPKNLHINTEYTRFDAKTDTFFNGRDAFPNRNTYVTSLWYSKKYKSNIKQKEFFHK